MHLISLWPHTWPRIDRARLAPIAGLLALFVLVYLAGLSLTRESQILLGLVMLLPLLWLHRRA